MLSPNFWVTILWMILKPRLLPRHRYNINSQITYKINVSFGFLGNIQLDFTLFWSSIIDKT